MDFETELITAYDEDFDRIVNDIFAEVDAFEDEDDDCEYYEDDDCLECGFDPYMGCYSDDC